MPSSVSRILHALGWVALAPMLGLCATQWFGIDDRRTIVSLQALTPFVLFCAAPIALAACLTRRHALAIAAVAPLMTLMALSFPVVFNDVPPAAAADSPRFSITATNVLYNNATPDAAADRIIASEADVLLLIELTAQVRAALQAKLPDGDYPYRVAGRAGGSESIQLWSRLPIVDGGATSIDGRAAIDVVLDVDGSEVRVVGVHPYPPTFNAPGWQQQLDAIADTAGGSELPTVLLGDFNGSRWHPSFRQLLDRGWHDAHEALGHGWSVSWPMDEGVLPPQFVRIDHALFRNGLTPTGIDDFEVPGSDHKAFRVDFGFTDAAMSSEE